MEWSPFPLLYLGAAGYGVVRHRQQKLLRAEKEELLQEAPRRRDEIEKAIADGLGGDQLRQDQARNIGVRLGDVIKHLEHDLASPSS